MSLTWHRDLPVWDADKQRIVGNTPEGVLDSRYADITEGTSIPCNWFRVERQGTTVGYGWIDVVWGDAEILLASAAESQKTGVGSFILEHLEEEARGMGLNYIYNMVRPTHPDAEGVTAWLVKRGFESKPDGRLVRRVDRSATASSPPAQAR